MFNEYGDSIYSGGFVKRKTQAQIDNEVLLDTIEHLRAMIIKIKGKKAFEDLGYKTYEVKCKSLRESLTAMTNDLDSAERDKTRLIRQVAAHERTIKRQEELIRLSGSELGI